MAATFCKLTIQLLNEVKHTFLNEEIFGGLVDDYCKNFEPPPEPEPRPEDKNTRLANIYQVFFNLLKKSELDKMLDMYIKFMKDRIGSS